jgi:hypothetical protein
MAAASGDVLAGIRKRAGSREPHMQQVCALRSPQRRVPLHSSTGQHRARRRHGHHCHPQEELGDADAHRVLQASARGSRAAATAVGTSSNGCGPLSSALLVSLDAVSSKRPTTEVRAQRSAIEPADHARGRSSPPRSTSSLWCCPTCRPRWFAPGPRYLPSPARLRRRSGP